MDSVKYYFWVAEGMSETSKAHYTYVASKDFDAALAREAALDHLCAERFEELAALQDELRTQTLRADAAVGDANDAERREAALREELADISAYNDKLNAQCEGMQQRLTAAEQRNAALEKDLGKVQSLARRTLWLAYCWNDHNFREAHTYAQTAAELSGIKSFEEANKFIESWPQPTESGASHVD